MQQKIHFECDYTEGAHPKILKRFMETNMEQDVYKRQHQGLPTRAEIRQVRIPVWIKRSILWQGVRMMLIVVRQEN